MLEKFPWQNVSGSPIIGVDEVGRGCLAGPVYAAAAVLDPSDQALIDRLTDSKKISAPRRKELSILIKKHHKVAVGFASVEEITELNILWAAMLAMRRAVEALGVGLEKAHVLVDGNREIPKLDCQQTALVKGDLRAAPISAASIVAKVTRDELLMDLAGDYPEYGFEKHKGYSTRPHKEAIEKFGPCRIHRPSFAGVREHL